MVSHGSGAVSALLRISLVVVLLFWCLLVGVCLVLFSCCYFRLVSRGVTTCAGMTAYTVLLAQTKVGFLIGCRKKSFLALPEDEQMVQLEEAYARATVAITRARALSHHGSP